jgi:hypothetical protein
MGICINCKVRPSLAPEATFKVDFQGVQFDIGCDYDQCQVCKEKDFYEAAMMVADLVKVVDDHAGWRIEVDWDRISNDPFSGGTTPNHRLVVIELLIDINILTYLFADQYLVEVGGCICGPADGSGGRLNFTREKDAILWTDANFRKARGTVRILKIAESIGNEEWKRAAAKLRKK